MLFLFTGNDTYTLRQETQKWKTAFLEKYGDFGLTHIKNINDIDINFLSETLFSSGLFGGIKLTLIEIQNAPKNTESEDIKTEIKTSSKNNNEQTLLAYLEKNLENIPEEHRVLISYASPDKRTTFYKKLTSVAQETKVFQTPENPEEFFLTLKKKYRDTVTPDALRKIIEYKGIKIEKIIPELDKLLILHLPVDKKHIELYITPEFEESIFVLVTALLSSHKKQVFELMSKILEGANIYLLYNSLLANLRVHRYILFLQEKDIALFLLKRY